MRNVFSPAKLYSYHRKQDKQVRTNVQHAEKQFLQLVIDTVWITGPPADFGNIMRTRLGAALKTSVDTFSCMNILYLSTNSLYDNKNISIKQLYRDSFIKAYMITVLFFT